ncbi:hypothetical protein [Methylobacterium sp. WSM2598]|uniref:hypothetical protein n=1 Tax=Methylobacterium sp. WSM2598 TaxID=398261 RepID=UPI0003640BB6|nr:hypothetical protein [Methylobacterium sp. WSM2598]
MDSRWLTYGAVSSTAAVAVLGLYRLGLPNPVLLVSVSGLIAGGIVMLIKDRL